MNNINLQKITKPKEGVIEYYWFENENIGLKNTLFHSITIPLEPFDSSLEYVEQPEDTALLIEWVNLGLKDPTKLDGIEITSEKTKDVEASVYIGAVHNRFIIHSLQLKQITTNKYEIWGKITIEFENEMVAKNEDFEFSTTAVFIGEA